MAASGSKHSAGTTLSVGSSITEVLSVSGPGMKRETIDVTHLGSDNTAREFIAGLFDGGEVTVELQFIKAVTTTLTGFVTSGTAQSCTLTLGGSLGAFAFSAIVSGFEPKVATGEKITATLTLRTTGVVSFT